eukprot:9139320-Alexandrium_andersonii.AAC.1
MGEVDQDEAAEVGSKAGGGEEDPDGQAKPPTHGRRGGKQQNSGRKSKVVAGKRQCDLCKKQKGIEEFSPGSAKCHPCKQAVDNIRYSAKKQGCLDWFETQMANEATRLQLIDAYHRKCPPTLAGKRKTGKPFP